MSEENKQSNTDPNDPLERLLGREENVSKADNLEKNTNPSNKEVLEVEELKKITGRDYKTKDDVVKHIEELNKFVGDKSIAEARKKASEYDKLMAEAKIISGEDKTNQNINEPSEISKLREDFERSELLRKHPESESVLQTIQAISKAEGISMQSAYEKHLEPIVKAKLEADKAKETEQNISVNSKQRMTSDKANKLSEAGKRLIERRTEDNEQNLVKEFFSE